MDINEHLAFSRMPMHSLSLRLARSVIKMEHGPKWRVDKRNQVYDLIIGLTGHGHYQIGTEQLTMGPGDALLIPPNTRFQAQHDGSPEPYTGMAQHFTLELFGREEIIGQMRLHSKIKFSDWDTLKPLVTHYRKTALLQATTLSQHHQFMVLLLAYFEQAFIGWETGSTVFGSKDQLSLHIMFVASNLSSDPLSRTVDSVLDTVPYNQDYFRRAFKERIGMTPHKFGELKRMELALSRLDMGYSVKQVAAEMGYSDPYFFSRMFKRYMGASPAKLRDRSYRNND